MRNGRVHSLMLALNVNAAMLSTIAIDGALRVELLKAFDISFDAT